MGSAVAILIPEVPLMEKNSMWNKYQSSRVLLIVIVVIINSVVVMCNMTVRGE